MKKKWIILFLLALFLLSSSACTELTEEDVRMRNEERWGGLPGEIQEEHQRRADFVEVFWFDYENRAISSPLREIKRSGKLNIAFVASQEDAEAGDESTFYFWPRTVQWEGRPTDITNHVLYVLNHILYKEFDGWDTVPFTYPVIIEDLIEHWEAVWALCISLDIVRPWYHNRLDYPTTYNELYAGNAEKNKDE